MRGSVSLSDDVNRLIADRSKGRGVSKNRYISMIVDGKLNPKRGARGAGRKQQFGETHKQMMKHYHSLGKSYREIAKMYDCSHVTVSKLINDQE